MYEKLAITENHLQVLTLFARGFTKEYYIRQVHQSLKMSPRTAQLILEDLEKKAILESMRRGKIRVYKLKKSEMAYHYLILCELYKRISLLRDNPLLKEIVGKIIPYIDGVGVIFGSYAKRMQKKDSDIDLFVAGACDEKKIKKVEQLYGKEIQIKQCTIKIFKEKHKKDILLKEVLENHIIIKGAEECMEIVMEHHE